MKIHPRLPSFVPPFIFFRSKDEKIGAKMSNLMIWETKESAKCLVPITSWIVIRDRTFENKHWHLYAKTRPLTPNSEKCFPRYHIFASPFLLHLLTGWIDSNVAQSTLYCGTKRGHRVMDRYACKFRINEEREKNIWYFKFAILSGLLLVNWYAHLNASIVCALCTMQVLKLCSSNWSECQTKLKY